jgi:hypothetical protein
MNKNISAGVIAITILFGMGFECGQQNGSASRSGTANTAVEPTSTPFPLDLDGQIARIRGEKSHPPPNPKITFELLKKNAPKYAGEPWSVKGKVLEIAERDGVTVARIGLYDFANKVVLVKGLLETDAVENDRVIANGYLAGEWSYTSQANWNITIPAMALANMQKVK